MSPLTLRPFFLCLKAIIWRETYIKRKPYEYGFQLVYFNVLILNFYYFINCNEITLSILLWSNKVRQIFVHALLSEQKSQKQKYTGVSRHFIYVSNDFIKSFKTTTYFRPSIWGRLAYMDENQSFFWIYTLTSFMSSWNSAFPLLQDFKFAQ